jgi:hypothetical protein
MSLRERRRPLGLCAVVVILIGWPRAGAGQTAAAQAAVTAAPPEPGDLIVGAANLQWKKLPRCRPNFFVASNGADTTCSNDGSQLIRLNADSLFSGTIDAARLPAKVVTFDQQDATFNPGRLRAGTNTTWTFKTSTDNAVASVLISSEGSTIGATPNGYAQLQINAQDEVPTPSGRVGSNMSAYLRVMSRTFNNQTCRGTLCPDMTELYSDHHLRFTVAGTGVLSFVRSGADHLTLDSDGFLKTYTTVFGFGPNGEEAYQLGPLGMEIGGDHSGPFYPPRLPPTDAMSSRRWVPGSVRVGHRLSVGCDVNSPFGRAVEPGEVTDQAGLCVQALGTTNIGAFISTPAHDMSTEATAIKIDTRTTRNLFANVGISIVSGNGATDAIEKGGTSGSTSLRVEPQSTSGPDYGIDVEAAAGVEHPLAVRVAGADSLMVCADGGLIVGGDCTKSKGRGTLDLARDLFRNGTAYTNPDYVFEHYYTGEVRRAAGDSGAAYGGLLPLRDVEKFAETHHQLPRIGDARGIFERQDAALASLEEAYLYIFQLQQQLQELKARLAALETRR